VRDVLMREDFVFLPGRASENIIKSACDLAGRVVAEPDESIAEGIHLWHFPFGAPNLDNFFEESGIVATAKEFLGTDHVLLNNCMLWVREHEDASAVDTRYHRDYTDNALFIRSGLADAVGIIVYFTSVSIEDGPTVYLPRAAAAGLPLYPRFIDTDDDNRVALDAAAVALTGPPGSILFHNLLGVHRASLPRGTGRRISLHAVIRRADAHWLGWTAWPRIADSHRFRSSVRHLTPAMRGLLGWPSHDWSGWDDAWARQIAALRFGIAAERGAPE
jgi:hypothetical protein